MADNLSHDQLKHEVEKIAEYLVQAKLEIAAFSRPETETGTDKNLVDAADELNEVVRHTEEATNLIMDKTDAIIQAAGNLADRDAGSKINESALGILEACSFQDITGQRIKKVLKTLEQVEYRVGNLIHLFGGTLPDGYRISEIATEATRRPDENLLNGPQLSKDAPSQADIDKLFSSS